MKPLSIYIHIPFCVRKCFYCDFLSGPGGEQEKREYLAALLREIEREAKHYRGYQVQTVFIGGGTPSVMESGAIQRILGKVREHFLLSGEEETEITIEVNPGTVSEEKLWEYRRAGVNRLSIGLQSAREEELKWLGRIHNWEDFLQTFQGGRKAGFRNINVDVMSALPGQSMASCQETLEKVVALQPEHVSAYGLILEEGTPFFQQFAPGRAERALLPSEEEDRQMYQMTGRFLKENHYERYEISNYARAGYECRHNMVYWQRGDYVGFGLGASSMVSEVRWNNRKEMAYYVTDHRRGEDARSDWMREHVQRLTVAEQMEEFMFLGLRLTKGVSRREFSACFQKEMEEVYGEVLSQLQKENLIRIGERVRLTEFGTDISNYVMAQFLISE